MSFVLKDNLRLEALDVIGKIDLIENCISRLSGFGNLESKFLNFCLQNMILSQQELRDSVHKRLLKIGRDNMKISSQGIWADHVKSPHALAYAIKHGEFKESEIAKIKFNPSHGHTAENFMLSQIADLIDRIILEALEKAQPGQFNI